MTCLIVDDEYSARSRLKRLLAGQLDLEIAGEAENGILGLEQITSLQPDLLFLDIEMPELNGFQMLKAIPASAALPLIVFVTAYDDHALAAFEADALAYLLKPIDEQRLASTLHRARQLVHDPIRSTEERRRVVDMVRRATPRIDHIVGTRQGRFVLLRPGEILYFTAESRVIKAHTASDAFGIEMTLNELEDCLSAQRFFRAHRGTLVNLAYVREIEPYFRSSYLLILKDAARSEIRVSERQAKLLREKIPGL